MAGGVSERHGCLALGIAALYGLLHMQEVALRDVADGRMTQVYGMAWLDDPSVLTVAYQRDCVARARQTRQQARKVGTPPQLVAELNFGFWSSLFGRQSHHLWQALRPIFQAKGIQHGCHRPRAARVAGAPQPCDPLRADPVDAAGGSAMPVSSR